MITEEFYIVKNDEGKGLNVHDHKDFHMEIRNLYGGVNSVGFIDGSSYIVENSIVEIKQNPGLYRIGDSETKIVLKGEETEISKSISKLEKDLAGKFKLFGRKN